MKTEVPLEGPPSPHSDPEDPVSPAQVPSPSFEIVRKKVSNHAKPHRPQNPPKSTTTPKSPKSLKAKDGDKKKTINIQDSPPPPKSSSFKALESHAKDILSKMEQPKKPKVSKIGRLLFFQFSTGNKLLVRFCQRKKKKKRDHWNNLKLKKKNTSQRKGGACNQNHDLCTVRWTCSPIDHWICVCVCVIHHFYTHTHTHQCPCWPLKSIAWFSWVYSLYMFFSYCTFVSNFSDHCVFLISLCPPDSMTKSVWNNCALTTMAMFRKMLCVRNRYLDMLAFNCPASDLPTGSHFMT